MTLQFTLLFVFKKNCIENEKIGYTLIYTVIQSQWFIDFYNNYPKIHNNLWLNDNVKLVWPLM